MTITTSKGKAFDINFINSPHRANNRIMIDLEDDRPLAEIAADFDGLATITKTDDIRPDATAIYEGFASLVGIRRNTEKGTVLLTLERSDGA